MSSTYRPRYNGGWPGMIVPVKIHGALGQVLSPMEIRMDLAFSYQWRGDRLRPYSVFLRRR